MSDESRFCAGCTQYNSPGYLDDAGQCQRCARLDEPCVYRAEPRGAFGLAGGWCSTHNVGWNWCEHTKGQA